MALVTILLPSDDNSHSRKLTMSSGSQMEKIWKASNRKGCKKISREGIYHGSLKRSNLNGVISYDGGKGLELFYCFQRLISGKTGEFSGVSGVRTQPFH